MTVTTHVVWFKRDLRVEDHAPLLEASRRGRVVPLYMIEPELRTVPHSFIHEPWRIENPPADYPQPIVHHESAIKHARLEISKRWKQETFRDQAKAVNHKLGSRNRPPSRSKNIPQKPIQQLSLDV